MKKVINFYEMADSWMNFNDEKPLLYELIEDFIYFCFFYPIAIVVLYAVSHDTLQIIKGFIILIAIFAMTVIRKKIKHLSLFIIMHIALMAIYFLLAQNFLDKLVYTLFLLPHFFISFKKRLNQSREYIKLTYIMLGECLLGVLYIALLFFNLVIPQKFIIVLSLLSVLVFIAYYHIVRANKLMDWEQKYTDNASGNLNKYSRVFSGLAVLIICIFLGLSYGLGLFKAAGNIDNSIINFFAWISSNKASTEYKPPKETTSNSDKEEQQGLEQLRKNNKPTPKILIMFYTAMEYIVGAIVIILIIFFIIAIIREFYRTFYDKIGNPNEKREFVFSLDDVVEHTKVNLRKITKVISHPVDLSNRKKIRKLYKKKVLSYKAKGISLDINQSTGEIENEINMKAGSNLSVLTSLYDTARYSKNEPSKEDLEKARNLTNS